ncbi:sigma-54 dependent transcriptional regulator [Acidobacteria bacterium AH-259-G07]|nr:sigma-54 dependent transcriptional regulator [Acidobacteria bacterium AH-259-G07]
MTGKRHKLLIVDDELANLQKLKRTFVDEFQVYQARNAEEALALLKDRSFTVIVTDQKMPGMSGVELLGELLEVCPDTVRIILTGYTDVDDLMDAINRGQVDRYVTKPWEPHSLKLLVKQEVERWELRRENERLSHQLKLANERLEKENRKLKQEMEWLRDSEKHLVYKSRAMQELLDLLDRVVVTDSTVLIQGETGTGKELLARYIHEKSSRRDQAFIPVNCAAIPAELVESAFFGHRRGAFTGATEHKKGYFELADSGSLFLDEIGESPMELQVKLLRVLQDGEIFPVGAQRSKQIDVRLIASTNRSLSHRVEEGRFRQDLFFRLNVFSVFVPPLRARKEDIEALSHFFLERFGNRLTKDVPGFEPATLEILKDYDWPGNVRELENEIERMLILSDPGQPVSPTMVSERIRFHHGLVDSRGLLREKLAELEQRLILDAIKAHHYNKSHAAEALGISRQTIIAKLKQYENR